MSHRAVALVSVALVSALSGPIPAAADTPRVVASETLVDLSEGAPMAPRAPGWTPRPRGWDRGAFREGGGLTLRLDLGTRRVNWNHARIAVHEFPEPVDLAEWSGLRVRASRPPEQLERVPRIAAGLWLRERDGSWYYVKAAVPLSDPENEAVVLFEDFVEAEWVAPGSHMDEDYVLDRRAISHLGVGVVNPLGVGEVVFTVERIDLVRCEAEPEAPARLAATGRLLSVNGRQTVPPGLFGGYAPDLPQRFRPGCQRYLSTALHVPRPRATEAFHIDCWFDRYQPATLLGAEGWEERLAAMGRAYARKAQAAGYRAHLEFWNEPYLNWAKPGDPRNYRSDFYDIDRAGEGRPVIARKTGMLVPYLEWYPAGSGWRVGDSTQFTYWSGRGNGFLYDRMLLAVGRAVKETWPEVRLIAGWDFRWNEDHWAGWHLLYKPTIDRAIQYIDGVSEHHYQGDTTAMNGTYEVLAGYAWTQYEKWLPCYNTETNDLLDAPARGAVDTPEEARRATQYRRSVYNLRDVLYSVLQSPDKCLGRTVIHSVRADGVERFAEVAYGIMRNLRGRLVETASDDPRVWCVASVDGTDPEAMPPDPDAPPALVVMAFNDHRRPRDVELALSAPTGTTFAGGGTVERTWVDKETFEIGVATGSAAGAQEGGTSARFAFRLAERSAWKVTLPLAGRVPTEAEVRRRQFFSPDLLVQVLRDQPFRTTVRPDPAVLAEAKRAWLRLVVEDVDAGEGSVRVCGRRLDLPKAMTADNVTRIVELAVDPAALLPETDLQFAVNPGNHLGYRVDMASIVLETGTPLAGEASATVPREAFEVPESGGP